MADNTLAYIAAGLGSALGGYTKAREERLRREEEAKQSEEARQNRKEQLGISKGNLEARKAEDARAETHREFGREQDRQDRARQKRQDEFEKTRYTREQLEKSVDRATRKSQWEREHAQSQTQHRERLESAEKRSAMTSGRSGKASASMMDQVLGQRIPQADRGEVAYMVQQLQGGQLKPQELRKMLSTPINAQELERLGMRGGPEAVKAFTRKRDLAAKALSVFGTLSSQAQQHQRIQAEQQAQGVLQTPEQTGGPARAPQARVMNPMQQAMAQGEQMAQAAQGMQQGLPGVTPQDQAGVGELYRLLPMTMNPNLPPQLQLQAWMRFSELTGVKPPMEIEALLSGAGSPPGMPAQMGGMQDAGPIFGGIGQPAR